MADANSTFNESRGGGDVSLNRSGFKSFITPRMTSFVTQAPKPQQVTTKKTKTTIKVTPVRAGVAPGEVTGAKANREKEKRDIQGLNERLANYIEKVRFLENQNAELGNEIDEMRATFGVNNDAIKSEYEPQLDEARKRLDDLERDKAKVEVRIQSVQDDIEDIKQKLNEAKLLRQRNAEKMLVNDRKLEDAEPELNYLRQKLDDLSDSRNRDKLEKERIEEELDKAKLDLDTMTLNHIDAENRRQTVEEEIAFLQRLHDMEKEDMELMVTKTHEPPGSSDYWKHEISQAINDIKSEYDNRFDRMRDVMVHTFEKRVDEYKDGIDKSAVKANETKIVNKEIRDETNNLRSRLPEAEAKNADLEKQLKDLQKRLADKENEHDKERDDIDDELEKLNNNLDEALDDVDTMTDRKLSLEMEIAAYRRLLEAEENRRPQPGEDSRDGKSRGKTYKPSGKYGDKTGGSDKSKGAEAGGTGLKASGSGASHDGHGKSPSKDGVKTSKHGGKDQDHGGEKDMGKDDGADKKHKEGTKGKPGQVANDNEIKAKQSPQAAKNPQHPDKEADKDSAPLGKMQAKTTATRTNKGPIKVQEATPKFVSIENVEEKKDLFLDNWKIIQRADTKRELSFQFPAKLTLGGMGTKGAKLKIWANRKRPFDQQQDLEANNIEAWLSGVNVVTTLANDKGEERATLTQKTTYSS